MERKELEEKLGSEVSELDLSRDEDLSIGLMNLISLEEHLFFTHEKTGNKKHLEMLSEIRKIRTEAMEEIVDDTEGEEWCISKHLLSASMRLRETGDKMLDRNREKAEKFYDQAFSLYSMFWAINFEAGNSEIARKTGGPDSEVEKEEKSGGREGSVDDGSSNKGKDSWLDSLKDTVKTAVDCCKEI